MPGSLSSLYCVSISDVRRGRVIATAWIEKLYVSRFNTLIIIHEDLHLEKGRKLPVYI